jgi:hypothetical protein
VNRRNVSSGVAWGGGVSDPGEHRWWVWSVRKGWQLVKPAHRSKTEWLNLLACAIYVLHLFAGDAPPSSVFGIILAILNIILRFFTDEPIRLRR